MAAGGLAGSATRPECRRQPAIRRAPSRPATGSRPLYSFNGTSPGPTIRVRGNERLRVTVRNHLGPNLGRVPVGPCPDPFEQQPEVFAAAICRMQKEVGIDCKAPPTTPLIFEHIHELLDAMPAPVRDTSCLPGPVNLPHASHTTNLHTHGLHVNPGINANGTFGDNTFSRVLPRADGEMRRTSKDANCRRPLEPTSASAKAATSTRSACPAKARPPARPRGGAASARHALVSPACARRHARSGRQRPRRFPHRRRRRRRRDQSRDDGSRSSGSHAEDRPVRLSRAADHAAARRSLLRGPRTFAAAGGAHRAANVGQRRRSRRR